MKLSVIVCVYNTKIEYFESCLSSLRNESIGKELEICVIDDGSTVDYSSLVTKYGLIYKRTENRGILAARLSGVEMASGDYITFCDSDDTVSFDYHRPMLDIARRENADIVINDWAFHTDNSRYFCKQDITICEDIAKDGVEIIEKFFEKEGKHHSIFVLWNKIYDKELLRRAAAAVSQSELNRGRCSYSEDTAINFFAFLYASRLRSVHTGYYFYRLHTDQSVSVISRQKLGLQIGYMAKTLNIMRHELEKTGLQYLLPKLDEWRRLMSRSHYSHAKKKAYAELYVFIRESYGVKRLSRAKFSDGFVYAKNVLLPENFESIDQMLRTVYFRQKPLRVYCKPARSYSYRQLCRLACENENVIILKSAANADAVMPEEKISLRDRFIHNFFVYTAGTLLFPKGSRLREILKKAL